MIGKVKVLGAAAPLVFSPSKTCQLPTKSHNECEIVLLSKNPRPLKGSTAYVSLKMILLEVLYDWLLPENVLPFRGRGFLDDGKMLNITQESNFWICG